MVVVPLLTTIMMIVQLMMLMLMVMLMIVPLVVVVVRQHFLTSRPATSSVFLFARGGDCIPWGTTRKNTICSFRPAGTHSWRSCQQIPRAPVGNVCHGSMICATWHDRCCHSGGIVALKAAARDCCLLCHVLCHPCLPCRLLFPRVHGADCDLLSNILREGGPCAVICCARGACACHGVAADDFRDAASDFWRAPVLLSALEGEIDSLPCFS